MLVLIGDQDVFVVNAGVLLDSTKSAESMDPSLAVTTVRLDAVPAARVAAGAATGRAVVRSLAAAQSVGVGRACVELAVEYAGVRTQFGQPIGQFQAVKHLCADMFGTVELASASAWDAVRHLDRRAGQGVHAFHLTAAAAAAVCLPVAVKAAQDHIQVLGGVGYTWEHDAHLYLRRAATLKAFVGTADSARDVVTLGLAGIAPDPTIDLPDEADEMRPDLAAFRARHLELSPAEQRAALIEEGYASPHWPSPWGRGAGPVEQLVIAEELAGLAHPHYGIAEWIVPSLMEFGTSDQHERLLRPTLAGELAWCQMFSEPDAGSDAASIRTRGRRVEGGWLVRGRKVWTSRALDCDFGFATVRTGPLEDKHRTITVMVVDMHADGVTIRPLRDITGDAMFNEITLDDVFVPDRDVIGEVNAGWTVARATLGQERVTVGTQHAFGGELDLLDVYRNRADERPEMRAVVGELVGRELALVALTKRAAVRAVEGGKSGSEGTVAKLLRGEIVQRRADIAWDLFGRDALVATGDGEMLHERFLHARMATIASGTSQVTRNLIAERILHMPRG
ncbi:acyl-CoA dehydrogenase family protein [Aeromicrobium panaciterrae]|uniref:acyl-CoA dehydrogenase family protein n=1 Tax=Aeromicrobium panaciterrae TaxID=363861 RepID=UPI0031D0A5D7